MAVPPDTARVESRVPPTANVPFEIETPPVAVALMVKRPLATDVAPRTFPLPLTKTPEPVAFPVRFKLARVPLKVAVEGPSIVTAPTTLPPAMIVPPVAFRVPPNAAMAVKLPPLTVNGMA